MYRISYKDKSVEIPTCVTELSREQYEYYCVLALSLGSGAIDAEYFRIRWLSFLIGLGQADYTLLKPEYVDEIEAGAHAIDGFFSEAGEIQRLDFRSPVNLLPDYAGHQGPGDMLVGLAFGDFLECITAIECMADADEEEVAENYFRIARKLYHIPEGQPVPDILAFHAPTFFVNVWKILQEGPIVINGKEIDFRIIFRSSGTARRDDRTGWTGIKFEIASAGLFGSVKEVEQTDIWSVLLYLYKCKFEYLNEKRDSQNK